MTPPPSKLLIADILFTLSMPFHKKLYIKWFNSLIICSGVGNKEDVCTTFGRRRVFYDSNFPIKGRLLPTCQEKLIEELLAKFININININSFSFFFSLYEEAFLADFFFVLFLNSLAFYSSSKIVKLKSQFLLKNAHQILKAFTTSEPSGQPLV